MSAADKLAQVIAEHQSFTHAVERNVWVTRCECYEELPTPGIEYAYDALAAHQAVVVLAHLTAEGWAQGREQWGVQVHIASVAGRGTRVEPVDTEERARDPYRHVFVAHGETIESKTPVRRRVTDWEPVETGDQK